MARIIIHSSNVVGPSMAGPGIRCWEFAKALSENYEVILIAPGGTQVINEKFSLVSSQNGRLKEYYKSADVLITQLLTFKTAYYAARYGLKIIIDAYDPFPFEHLEKYKNHSKNISQASQDSSIRQLVFNFKMADGILCASEIQRDLWMGFLLGQRLITPEIYARDPTLRSYIDLVPFGLSDTPPRKLGPGLREKYGFTADDKIILWGGGIWNWFDPLSLIKAVEIISRGRKDVKLVFMGIQTPDSNNQKMEMTQQAIDLSNKLSLTNKTVYFNEGWIPYDERQNMLLDATIGASTHFEHLETKFSFRTRLLDNIWSQLPILATTGDSFAEVIDKEEIGMTVPPHDADSIVLAIQTMINDPQRIIKMKSNLLSLSKKFHWKIVIKPIHTMIQGFIIRRKMRVSDFVFILWMTSLMTFSKIYREVSIKLGKRIR